MDESNAQLLVLLEPMSRRGPGVKQAEPAMFFILYSCTNIAITIWTRLCGMGGSGQAPLSPLSKHMDCNQSCGAEHGLLIELATTVEILGLDNLNPRLILRRCQHHPIRPAFGPPDRPLSPIVNPPLQSIL